MSDDEMPTGMDGMDAPEGESDDDMAYGGGGDFGGNTLPDGVKKEIITKAPDDCWKNPKKGDEVTVHYVGTLESDGSEFDSSRSRDKPFNFTLGKGQVIQGWDLGVATMKKGELAKFTLSPEYAYGDAGSPPKIPEKATLVFEVELIGWTSKDDLFSDDGVIKTLEKEGSGWKTPKPGDEVLITMKIEGADGSLITEKSNVEYVLGSGTLGCVGQACDKALAGMKRGEESSLKCTQAYAADYEGGATVSLVLEEIFEVKDVSFSKDKSVMKKQVKEGEGYDMPKESSKVKLNVVAATDGTSVLPGFTPKLLEFTAGNGDVCDALECAAAEMKKGERAVLTINQASSVKEVGLGLQNISCDVVVMTVELQEFEKAKDTWDMSEEEKINFGTARKDIGASLFKAGRYPMALQRYKKVSDLFNYIDNFKEHKEKAAELKKVCELNKAACYLKIQEFSEAKKACEVVLKDEAQNVKALFRRAQAENGLKNFLDCIRDCKKVVELDPQNKDARLLIRQAQASQKEEDKKSKGLFANMCKALGKGPIPEPYKNKRPYEDDMDDDDDATMPGADDTETSPTENKGGDDSKEEEVAAPTNGTGAGENPAATPMEA